MTRPGYSPSMVRGYKKRNLMTESEAKTRKKRIDEEIKIITTKLENHCTHKEGLDTSSLSAHAVEEYPTETGPADYALFRRRKATWDN